MRIATSRTNMTFFFRLACMLGLLAASIEAHSQSTPTSDSVTPLMRQMVGSWKVEARMWPGPDAKAVDLPPAVAQRRLVNDAFLAEELTPADKSAPGAFTRMAYFSYNSINQQYEYFSFDSRLPQMMSYVMPGANVLRDGKVELRGTSFVAPAWGEAKNVPFTYRLTVAGVDRDKQVVQLYLKQQQAQAKEFLAFEYSYVRQR